MGSGTVVGEIGSATSAFGGVGNASSTGAIGTRVVGAGVA